MHRDRRIFGHEKPGRLPGPGARVRPEKRRQGSVEPAGKGAEGIRGRWLDCPARQDHGRPGLPRERRFSARPQGGGRYRSAAQQRSQPPRDSRLPGHGDPAAGCRRQGSARRAALLRGKKQPRQHGAARRSAAHFRQGENGRRGHGPDPRLEKGSVGPDEPGRAAVAKRQDARGAGLDAPRPQGVAQQYAHPLQCGADFAIPHAAGGLRPCPQRRDGRSADAYRPGAAWPAAFCPVDGAAGPACPRDGRSIARLNAFPSILFLPAFAPAVPTAVLTSAKLLTPREKNAPFLFRKGSRMRDIAHEVYEKMKVGSTAWIRPVAAKGDTIESFQIAHEQAKQLADEGLINIATVKRQADGLIDSIRILKLA